jgi:hypothetical protein
VVISVGGFEAGKIYGSLNFSVSNGFRFFWFSKSKFSLVKTGVRFCSGSNSVLLGFKKAVGLCAIWAVMFCWFGAKKVKTKVQSQNQGRV